MSGAMSNVEQVARATAAGRALRRRGDLAKSVDYDARSKRLRIELVSGIGWSIPVAKVQGLGGAPAAVIRTVRVEGGGYGLHWLLLVFVAPITGPALAGWGFVDNWLRSRVRAQNA